MKSSKAQELKMLNFVIYLFFHLTDMLCQPEHTVSQVLGSSVDSIITALDKDLVECLHWRKGALCYMYCHTVWNDKSKLEKSKPQIIKVKYTSGQNENKKKQTFLYCKILHLYNNILVQSILNQV